MSAKGLDIQSIKSLLLDNVDWSQKSLLLSLASIAFNPTAWNIVARNGEMLFDGLVGSVLICVYRVQEQNAHSYLWKRESRMLLPCYHDFLIRYAARPLVRPLRTSTRSLVLTYSRYQRALQDQPKQAILPAEYATVVPAALFALGQLFVITSTWQLGVTGTFLGDYFGILMDARVEG